MYKFIFFRIDKLLSRSEKKTMDAIQNQMFHSDLIRVSVQNVIVLDKQLKNQKQQIEDMETTVHELNQKLKDTKIMTESSSGEVIKSLKAEISGMQRELKEEQEMQNSKPRMIHRLSTKISALEMKNKKLDDELMKFKRDAATVFVNMIQENPCYISDDRELVTIDEWLKKHELCDDIPPLPYNLRRNELHF